jgi:hypothetical protein
VGWTARPQETGCELVWAACTEWALGGRGRPSGLGPNGREGAEASSFIYLFLISFAIGYLGFGL